MIAPDLWTLPSPKSDLKYEIRKLDRKFENIIHKRMEQHHFNQIISIILPDTKQIPTDINEIFTDTDHYVIEDVPLSELIDRRFIEAFVKRGKLYALSTDTRIDIDDCVAITASHQLILSIRKEIYQSLGLEGRVSHYHQKHKSKYLIQIDLANPDLKSGTKHYERIKSALTKDILPKFTLQLQWESPDPTICPSSIAKYFSDRQLIVHQRPTNVRSHQEYSTELPLIPDTIDHPDKYVKSGEELYATPDDIIEYLGMLTLNCDRDENDYLNSYKCFGRKQTIGSCKVVRWMGMFTADHCIRVLTALKKFISNRPELPWTSMYCHGMQHCPVNFGHREHYFHTNGDNSYGICVRPDQQCFWFECTVSGKEPK